MKYKAIIFDLDGTLLDTLQDLTNAVNNALTINNFPIRTIDEIRSFIGNGTKVLIKRALPHIVDDDTHHKVFTDFQNYYKSHINDFTKPYEKIIELLDYLKINGYKIGIISNKDDALTNKMKDLYFSKFVDLAIGTRDFSKTKPNPESTIEMIKYFDLAFEDCLFVGDSLVDIETAKNANVDCVSVTWGFKDKEFFKSLGIKNVIDSPFELLNYLR